MTRKGSFHKKKALPLSELKKRVCSHCYGNTCTYKYMHLSSVFQFLALTITVITFRCPLWPWITKYPMEPDNPLSFYWLQVFLELIKHFDHWHWQAERWLADNLLVASSSCLGVVSRARLGELTDVEFTAFQVADYFLASRRSRSFQVCVHASFSRFFFWCGACAQATWFC
jgi:hypothetical protein